jgi:hypothetical protein
LSLNSRRNKNKYCCKTEINRERKKEREKEREKERKREREREKKNIYTFAVHVCFWTDFVAFSNKT